MNKETITNVVVVGLETLAGTVWSLSEERSVDSDSGRSVAPQFHLVPLTGNLILVGVCNKQTNISVYSQPPYVLTGNLILVGVCNKQTDLFTVSIPMY